MKVAATDVSIIPYFLHWLLLFPCMLSFPTCPAAVTKVPPTWNATWTLVALYSFPLAPYSLQFLLFPLQFVSVVQSACICLFALLSASVSLDCSLCRSIWVQSLYSAVTITASEARALKSTLGQSIHDPWFTVTLILSTIHLVRPPLLHVWL